MAIKTFKEILDNKGYRVNSNDRKIFENGDIQSFFGLGQNDCIEFIIYDINDNQLIINPEVLPMNLSNKTNINLESLNRNIINEIQSALVDNKYNLSLLTK